MPFCGYEAWISSCINQLLLASMCCHASQVIRAALRMACPRTGHYRMASFFRTTFQTPFFFVLFLVIVFLRNISIIIIIIIVVVVVFVMTLPVCLFFFFLARFNHSKTRCDSQDAGSPERHDRYRHFSAAQVTRIIWHAFIWNPIVRRNFMKWKWISH